jgi:L-seryl-tRNA(Ser) seleniumtransferase
MRSKEANAEQGNAAMRHIPPVDALLRRPALRSLETHFGHSRVVQAVRQALEALRDEISRNPIAIFDLAGLEAEIIQRVQTASQPSLCRVINATGVILHTNLGRAPLAQEALKHILDVAGGYSNLEFDLEAGMRGKRDSHTERLFHDLLGAESTLVVNNNAAALFLTLNSVAEGQEVIVSRGELVEIGGSFRIPEICSKSGCLLRETGTTNRTRIADYARAINERTRAILRVHTSNFRMVGFTERPEIEELAALAAQHGVALIEDLGSGCLRDLKATGIQDEPMVLRSLAAGVDVATFSGDKLLGGPQCGIILGKRDRLATIRANPLFRALRVDKLTIAALEATVALYLRGDFAGIPAQRMIQMTQQMVATRAQNFARRFAALDGFLVSLCDGESVAGGGSLPGQSLPTTLIAITHATLAAKDLSQSLRRNRPPIIARVEEDRLLLDLRTVFEPEEDEILQAFRNLAC